MIRIRNPIFFITPEEREEFVRKEPQSLKYIHKVLGAQEYINNIASLYDDNIVPSELRIAHQKNDRAVMEAYKLKKIIDGKKTLMTESETVKRLFEMYEEKKQKNE